MEERIDDFERIFNPKKIPKILTHGPPYLFQGYRVYNATQDIHKRIRLDWLVNNKFIKFTEEDIYRSHVPIMKNDTCHVFIGEHNEEGKPNGMIQLVQENGDFCEGFFTPDCQKNGFCITFKGRTNEIDLGWYKNDIIHGNHMTVNATSMYIKKRGWYENGAH